MNNKLTVFLIGLATLTIVSFSYALDIKTHKTLNGDIAKQITTPSGFSLDTYLWQQLAFEKGVWEKFTSQSVHDAVWDEQNQIFIYVDPNHTVWEWLQNGGAYEDFPSGDLIAYRRSRNHFHNPLPPLLENAGYTGPLSFCNIGQCPESAVLWSQGPQNSSALNPGGDWSWKKTKENYYKALTSTVQADRDWGFADTFIGLGQLMHLVQDMSVPEHVRNDFHSAYAYEEWVRDNPSEALANAFSNPVYFDWSALTQLQSVFPTAAVPIANLFDINQYNGTNPQITVQNYTVTSTPTGPVRTDVIGLSEYTQANYVSADTLFTNDWYPKKSSSVIIDPDTWKVPDELNPGTGLVKNMVNRPYYVKIADGETGYLLAGVPFTYFEATRISPVNPNETMHFAKEMPVMDENVYRGYATNLLPRAVGYSAELLNYFFRGTLEISAPSTTVYAITDGKETPQLFTKIKANIKNTTPDEQISNGFLQAVARYKIIPNYDPYLANYPPDGAVMTGDGSAAHPGVQYTYSVSEVSEGVTNVSLASGEARDFTFSFPTNNPIPAGITDLTLQVVFKGTIGNEQDNAIAVGMKDLMEPTHLVFWNLTDRFSLQYPDSVHKLYSFNDPYSSEDLLGFQDREDFASILHELDETGENKLNDETWLQPQTYTFKIAFSGTKPHELISNSVATVQLAAGQHARLIVLVDDWYPYVQVSWPDNTEPTGVDWTADYFMAVWNQSYNGVWDYTTPIKKFRFGPVGGEDQPRIPIIQHFYTGILNCYPGADDSAGNKYCPYPEEESPRVDLTPVAAAITFE